MAIDDQVTLGISYDANSIQSANQAVASMSAQLDNVTDSANQLGDAGQQAASRLQSAFSALRNVVDDTDSSISNLRIEMHGAVVEANNLQQASNANSGLNGLSGGLRVGSQLVGSGNPLGGGLRFASEITRLGSSLDKIEESLPEFVDGLTSADNVIANVAKSGSDLAVKFAGAGEGSLEAAIAGVGAVAVPAAAALAAIGAGFVYFESVIQPAKSALDEAVKSVDDYYKAIVDGTTASIKAQIDKAQADLAIQQQKLTTLQAPYQISGPLDPLKNALANVIDPSALKDIQATGQAIKDDQAAIDALNRAIGSNTVAANDAAAAQDAKAKQDIADLNKQAQLQTQRDQLATQGATAIQKVIDADNAKITSDEAELEQIYKLRAATDANSKAYQTYTDEANKLLAENTDLSNQVTDLTENLLPAAKATEDFKNTVKDIGTVLSGTAKQADNVVKAFQAISDAAAKNADAIATTNAARQLQDSRAQQDFDSNRLNELNTFHQAQLAKDANFAQSQADQLAKLYDSANQVISNEQATAIKDSQAYAQQQHDNALKLAEQIQQITNQANASELDAAYKLDAHGVENAKRQAATQITNLTTTYNDQKAISDRNERQKLQDMADQAQKQRDQQLAIGLQSLSDQQRNYTDQRNLAQTAENQKLADQKSAFDLASRRRDEDRQIQDAARDKAYRAQQTALNQHLTDMLTIQTTKQKQISDSFGTWWNSLVTQAAANAPNPVTGTNMPGTYTAGNGGGGGGGVQSDPNSIGVQFTNGLQSAANSIFSFLGSFDVGTGIQGTSRDGLAKLHKGEIVLDPTTSDSLRKGLGIRGVDAIGSGIPSTANNTGITMGTVNITQNFNVNGSDMSLDKMKPIVKQAMTSVLQDLAGGAS